MLATRARSALHRLPEGFSVVVGARTLPAMQGKELTASQLDTLAGQLTRHGEYFARLESRMTEAGFPQPDELFVQVRTIRSEIERLTATLNYLADEKRWRVLRRRNKKG